MQFVERSHPTPSPVDREWLYGHNWVCLAVLMAHPLWDVIALPLLSMLHVRKCEFAALDPIYGWEFQTKHQLALRMTKELASWLRVLGSQAKLLVVFDGAYAAHELISSLNKMNITVASRLRSNAKLFYLPPARKPDTHGRTRKYDFNRIDLSRNVWSNIACWNLNAWLYALVELEC